MSEFDDFLRESELRLAACARMRRDGTYPPNDDYREIVRLHEMLACANIPHVYGRYFDGWFIHYPCPAPDYVCSCIQHLFSYGAFRDRLEIRGLLKEEEGDDGDVCGYLTAEDVFSRIAAHWVTEGGKSEMEGE